MVSESFVRSSFAHFEADNGPAFLQHVADNVSWTATGIDNPLGGHYTSKQEVGAKIFGRIIPKMATALTAKVTNVLTAGAWAVVELKSQGRSKGGKDYNQELCWICRYEDDKIVEVRMYLDTALLKALLDE
jgi:ketosteroid isomerase-like protein